MAEENEDRIRPDRGVEIEPSYLSFQIDEFESSTLSSFENLASSSSKKPDSVLAFLEKFFRSMVEDESSTVFVGLEAKFLGYVAYLHIRLVPMSLLAWSREESDVDSRFADTSKSS